MTHGSLGGRRPFVVRFLREMLRPGLPRRPIGRACFVEGAAHRGRSRLMSDRRLPAARFKPAALRSLLD